MAEEDVRRKVTERARPRRTSDRRADINDTVPTASTTAAPRPAVRSRTPPTSAARARADRLGGAEAPGDREPLGVRVEHDRRRRRRRRPARAASARASPRRGSSTRSPGPSVDGVERVHGAGERLGQRSQLERESVGQPVQVLAHDPLAARAASRRTRRAGRAGPRTGSRGRGCTGGSAARRRVAAEDHVAGRDAAYALPHRLDRAGELVPEARRVGRDRRVPALDALDVGAAAWRPRRSSSTTSPRPGAGRATVLDPQVARSVQQRGPHARGDDHLDALAAARAASAARGVLEREAVGDQPLGGDRRRAAISSSAARVSRGPAE